MRSSVITGAPDKPSYIPEIDTLRAVAVLLVVLFHLSARHVPGGYIGVDIFFVISGFVISRRYLSATLAGETTLAAFYLARFRRLAPALCVVLLLTTVVAYLVVLPSTLRLYAHSLLAQPFYLQNFVFWNEGDYFHSGFTKPLLHTWSLAVEEQFYLFFGLALVLFRSMPKVFLPLIGLAAVGSVISGLVLEPISPKSSFFMLPTRIWQFALGIGAYALAAHLGKRDAKWIDVLGLDCVLGCIMVGLLMGGGWSFPAANAYLACLATAGALVCLDVGPRRLAVLRLTPLRYIGRVSYGFYLWHWPPLVLYYLALNRWPTPEVAVALIALAFGGAVLSYHFIELPIRRGTFLSSASALRRFVFGATITTVGVASVLIVSEGAVYRYPADIQKFFAATQRDGTNRCPKAFRVANPSAEICRRTQTTEDGGILLLGDSHADMLDEMLAEMADLRGLSVYLNVRSCDLGLFGQDSFCGQDVLDRIVREAKDKGISHILAVSRWPQERMTQEAFEAQLGQLVGAGFDVTIMEAVPYGPDMDPVLRAREALAGGTLRFGGQSRERYLSDLAIQRALFEGAADRFGAVVEILRPVAFLCSGTECMYHTDGMPHYFDDRHLNATGRQTLRPMFEGFFASVEAE